MGRRPIPTELKILRGNPGHKPLNHDEPKPARPDRVPPAPGYLSKEAKKEWRRVAGILHTTKILTEADLTALGAYCVIFARWLEAESKIKEQGFITKTVNGNDIQNPYLAIANRAQADLLKWSIEFGLTPSARVRLRAPADDDTPSLAEQLYGLVGNAKTG